MSEIEDRIPLIIKCHHDGRSKRVHFQSGADMISYRILKEKVEDTFSLSVIPFSIRYWCSESGEWSTIADDRELFEAVEYFNLGLGDVPIRSQSERSDSSGEVGLEVDIELECEIHLSDFGSLSNSDPRGENSNDQASQNSPRPPFSALHYPKEMALNLESNHLLWVAGGLPVRGREANRNGTSRFGV
ncbi:hypothetical protein BD779DRAFT_337085 [Infundibulicybe gibba]|nr:hypothetical protein BD779DRAFT_337085 [Infundibulicybe gibba]